MLTSVCPLHFKTENFKFKWGMNCTNLTYKNYLWHITHQDHISTGFLDDSLLVGKSIESCTQNIIDTVSLFDKLGFVLHPDKSILGPAQVISYLGFQIFSVSILLH